ncbi:hypothetical protein F4805DRAFT_436681 [Annulohypoxylon moriforme]|nr:hypothetical protein F4805DRAFT_436681 [Annulohypoxylon moriforme]
MASPSSKSATGPLLPSKEPTILPSSKESTDTGISTRTEHHPLVRVGMVVTAICLFSSTIVLYGIYLIFIFRVVIGGTDEQRTDDFLTLSSLTPFLKTWGLLSVVGCIAEGLAYVVWWLRTRRSVGDAVDGGKRYPNPVLLAYIVLLTLPMLYLTEDEVDLRKSLAQLGRCLKCWYSS